MKGLKCYHTGIEAVGGTQWKKMELVREEGVILLHLLKQVEELEHFLRAVRSNRWVFSWSAIVRYVFEEDLSGRTRKKGLEGREYR